MIIVGYNGFSHSADVFGRRYRRSGRDRYRLLGHDAGVAVFIDGELVAAVEEERLNRQKKTSDFPHNALEWCLREAGVGLCDVDMFAFPWDFTPEVIEGQMGGVLASSRHVSQKLEELARLDELYRRVVSVDAIREDFKRRTGYEIPENRLQLVPHHIAHLMCGYYLSSEEDAAFLVSDGRAETLSAVMGEVDVNNFVIFDECSVDIANSLAMLYSKITRYLGFTPNNDEYKVMGLSAYAPPPVRNPLLEQVIDLLDNGRYALRFRNEMLDVQSYYRLFDTIFNKAPGGETDFEFMAMVARCTQDAVEQVTAHQLRALEERTDRDLLLLEGGLALNCVNNSRLLAASSQFKRMRVSFGASDVGVAIGAAHQVARNLDARIRHRQDPYLGPEFSTEEMLAVLRGHADRLRWQVLDGETVTKETAKLLCGKAVVGWFQGRLEFGPRALGNRSILANPGFPDIQDIINTRVKHRESFRPFAPILLVENAPAVLELGKLSSSPYMTFVFPVLESMRSRIPGASHVDGTARAQTVTDESNPRMASLLRAFQQMTGLPCLINTSFNVAGEPIVCTPGDAVKCFLGTDIDYLILGDIMVSKRPDDGLALEDLQ